MLAKYLLNHNNSTLSRKMSWFSRLSLALKPYVPVCFNDCFSLPIADDGGFLSFSFTESRPYAFIEGVRLTGKSGLALSLLEQALSRCKSNVLVLVDNNFKSGQYGININTLQSKYSRRFNCETLNTNDNARFHERLVQCERGSLVVVDASLSFNFSPDEFLAIHNFVLYRKLKILFVVECPSDLGIWVWPQIESPENWFRESNGVELLKYTSFVISLPRLCAHSEIAFYGLANQSSYRCYFPHL